MDVPACSNRSTWSLILNKDGIIHNLNEDGIIHNFKWEWNNNLNEDGIIHNLNEDGIIHDLNGGGIIYQSINHGFKLRAFQV